MILSGEEPFPMDKGTEWTYAGTVQWDQDGKAMQRRMTWLMRVDKRETQGDLDIATMIGWPGDLAFSSEDRKPSRWLLVRKGSQYFQTVSPLDARTLNPDTLIVNFPLTKDDGAMLSWSVEDIRRGPLEGVEGVDSHTPRDIYQMAYRAVSDRSAFSFIPGIGITSYRYSHHGSLSEVDVHLVRFARPRR
jgi:hypothetical protein